jgi:hypothetical protein
MDPSTSDNSPEPREQMLDTVASLASAVDELVAIARQRLQVFDIDLSQGGWQSAARAQALTAFLRRASQARLDIIVHDTRFIETSCARLLILLRQYAHAVTIYRTSGEARKAMDPLVIADGRHFLHRFHIEQPRATLAIGHPQLARPLVMRFDQIWATGEPGLSASVLGL